MIATKRNSNAYAIIGDTAYIYMRSGVTMVDADMVETIMPYTWCIEGTGYVMSYSSGKAVKLHRLITGAGSKEYVDHIDGNPLNNRKANLRLCIKQQNEFNSKVRSDNSSGYKGVCLDKRRGGYRAYITKNGHQKHIGRFETAVEAAEAYNKVAIELFGEYARLNAI